MSKQYKITHINVYGDQGVVLTGYTKNQFHLQLIPQWSLSYGGKNIDIPALRAKALITYLALENAKAHKREKLSALIWPNVDSQKSRSSLRQIISGLNRSIAKLNEDVLVQSRYDVGLKAELISTDINCVLANVNRGMIDPENMRQITGIRNILSEFDNIGQDYSDWIREIKAFIIRRSIDQLKSIFLDNTRPLEFRIRVAEAVVGLDDLDEDAIRTLMSAHTELNNSVVALRVYSEFYQKLELELDAEPSIETQDLAVQIKMQEFQAESALLDPTAMPVSSLKTLNVVTVAVLPFEYLGQDKMPEFILIGLLDQITCQLAANRAPVVISSNTTRKYLGKTPQPSEVGQALNANYVVSGSIRMDNREASVTIQLANSSDNRVVWANTHYCKLSEMYDVKTPIADDIVRAIVPSVDISELSRTASIPVEELEPYHLVLRSKDLIFGLEQTAFGKANNLLKRAIDLGPHFAPAHALLAEWFAISVWQGWSIDPAADRLALERHVRQAISLSPGDGRAIALWAHTRFIFDREYDEPLRLLDNALDLCPNDSETLIWSVPALGLTGHPARAIQNGKRAIELSPLDPFMFRNEHFLALAYYANGEYDISADLGLSSFHHAPNYGSNIRATIAALIAAGRNTETSALVEQHNTIEPSFSVEKFLPNHALRDREQRLEFGKQLIEAGLAH